MQVFQVEMVVVAEEEEEEQQQHLVELVHRVQTEVLGDNMEQEEEGDNQQLEELEMLLFQELEEQVLLIQFKCL